MWEEKKCLNQKYQIRSWQKEQNLELTKRFKKKQVQFEIKQKYINLEKIISNKNSV